MCQSSVNDRNSILKGRKLYIITRVRAITNDNSNSLKFILCIGRRHCEISLQSTEKMNNLTSYNDAIRIYTEIQFGYKRKIAALYISSLISKSQFYQMPDLSFNLLLVSFHFSDIEKNK
jgi:hypothetical protein